MSNNQQPHTVPVRTPSKMVSQAFSFLSSFEENGDMDNYDTRPQIDTEKRHVQHISVNRNGMKPTVENGLHTQITHDDKNCMKDGQTKPEFTIITYVENGDSNENHTSLSNSNHARDDSGYAEINPVYEVNDEDDMGSDRQEYRAEQSPDGTVSIDNQGTEHKAQKQAQKDSVYEGSDNESVEKTTHSDRNSVVIEGEVVTLRKPLSPIDRQSRLPTWKVNQNVVSEAFGFLKLEGNVENVDAIRESITEEQNSTKQEENNRRASLEQSDNIKTAHTTSVIQDVASAKQDFQNDEAETLNGEKCLVDAAGEVCIDKATAMHSYQDGDSDNGRNGDNGDENTEGDIQSADTTGDLCDTDDNLESKDTLGELVRRRKRGGKKSSQSDNANDDDGGSSDEDTGVYRESLRNSIWLYVGDAEERKQAAKQDNYVSLADLGLDADNDSLFGDPEDTGPLSPFPTPGHNRNYSTSTTVSEKEFKKGYHSISKRVIQRADSTQEYKRYTTTRYESPAEKAGLREGQVLISVNGVNILDTEHTDIISLVQKGTKTLTIQVGGGDYLNITDLQYPVKTGYLNKQTTAAIFKTWKRRYCILRKDSCLYYYKTEQETDPLGAIPLAGYTVKRHGDMGKCGFKLEKYSCKPLYFMADNRDDLTSWVGVLAEACKQDTKKDPWMDVTAQNVGLPALSIRNADCVGYLYKLARKTRRWRKKYCVLKDACIYNYKSLNAKEAEGVAHLHGYTVDGSDVSGKRFSFSLLPPESQMRKFCFYTENNTDKLRWTQAFSTSIKKWVKVD
ncbi:PKHA7-like protein [Mya arenaria]|uniref:PKHA7-like protein n=1 Tax=Mya arenaria TaxID=6604 RepID=A0ABY7F2D2_MYAAR|nr:PKHA7-like protein [Mya arenaria]